MRSQSEVISATVQPVSVFVVDYNLVRNAHNNAMQTKVALLSTYPRYSNCVKCVRGLFGTPADTFYKVHVGRVYYGFFALS